MMQNSDITSKVIYFKALVTIIFYSVRQHKLLKCNLCNLLYVHCVGFALFNEFNFNCYYINDVYNINTLRSKLTPLS